jgi:hypothetical protein
MHWLTTYDSEDGSPIGWGCECPIGHDHDGQGNLVDSDLDRARLLAGLDQIEALAKEAGGDVWRPVTACGVVTVMRDDSPPILVGTDDNPSAGVVARHIAAWDPHSVLELLQLIRDALGIRG